MTRNETIDFAINAMMDKQADAMISLRRAVNELEDFDQDNTAAFPVKAEIKCQRAVILACAEEIVSLVKMYSYE